MSGKRLARQERCENCDYYVYLFRQKTTISTTVVFTNYPTYDPILDMSEEQWHKYLLHKYHRIESIEAACELEPIQFKQKEHNHKRNGYYKHRSPR